MKSNNQKSINLKDSLPIIVGSIILIATIIVFSTVKIDRNSINVIRIASTIIRLPALIWVSKIAENEGRNKNYWVFFAFFLPSIALISIGYLRIKDKNR